MSSIGERIRKQRNLIGMSQQELATKLGYKNRSSINKIELNGYDIPTSKIAEIADALETTVDYLVGWDAKENEDDMVMIMRIMKNNKLRERLVSYARFLEESEK